MFPASRMPAVFCHTGNQLQLDAYSFHSKYMNVPFSVFKKVCVCFLIQSLTLNNDL